MTCNMENKNNNHYSHMNKKFILKTRWHFWIGGSKLIHILQTRGVVQVFANLGFNAILGDKSAADT